jgi:hypothetical protein
MADTYSLMRTFDGKTVKVKLSDTGQTDTANNPIYVPVIALSGSILLSGDTFQEQKTEVDAVVGVLTFLNNISTIEIYNTDATHSGTFTVNGIAIIVPATKDFKATIGGTPGKTVTIVGSTSYVVRSYT